MAGGTAWRNRCVNNVGVQELLDRNGRWNGGGTKKKYGALLRGLIFYVPWGAPMVHTYSTKGAKRYRY